MASSIIRVVITYVYFLHFAQFAFLEHVKSIIGFANLSLIMGVMGLSGFIFSLLAGYYFLKDNRLDHMKVGFIICASAALLSYFSNTLPSLLIAAFFIGVGLSVLTVSLATYLTPIKIGIVCGIGTGVAYFICNIPILFVASPQKQTLFSAFICIIGAVLKKKTAPINTRIEKGFKIHPDMFLYYAAICLALVWFDSAAFFVIQQAGELKSLTWIGEKRLWLNALVHLLFALYAGFLVTFARIRLCLFLSFIFLIVAVLFLQFYIQYQHYSGLLYCAGVSLYSTVLVAIPALMGTEDRVKKSQYAGLLYGVAGWFGSAMGIGMAQDLQRIPYTFILLSALVLIISNYKIAKNTCVIIFFSFFTLKQEAHAENQAILRGREVYIEEGCINCHSQYVRPVSKDIEMWGPEVNPESILDEEPPLIGNRRNGPDLKNVGNRRSKEWLKLHMIYPRLLSPNSFMPSYDYLFNDERGDSLVEYLLSLGKNTLQDRMNYISSWRPKIFEVDEKKVNAEKIFKNNCAQCHGNNGYGDGEAGKLLSVSPRNLVDGDYLYSKKEDTVSIAKVIKFGIYGTQMPGHEYLSDEEIIALAYYIRRLK